MDGLGRTPLGTFRNGEKAISWKESIESTSSITPLTIQETLKLGRKTFFGINSE
jgi:hypothetical protein